MSTPGISISAASPLTDAMGLMADRRIGALPVVEHGRVVGILTQHDVVTALAHQESA
jgi:CBS domain-containing protein